MIFSLTNSVRGIPVRTMDRPFIDDDREKRVVTADGQNVGRIHDVDDSATVDRHETDRLHYQPQR